jgi:hypothetical protein
VGATLGVWDMLCCDAPGGGAELVTAEDATLIAFTLRAAAA